MVSLVTMEKPKTFASDDIKDEKVKVIKQLSIDKEDIMLGQYQGYKEAINIESDSTTETFVFAKAYINNDRWKGVPIYLLTGKSLDEKKSEIIINFKNDSNNFKNVLNNKLIIRVAPVEGVNFIFNVKEAGLGEKVVPANLDYCHTCNYLGNTPEAYEKLLLDLFNKQNSLFTRWDEIESSWKIIDEVKTYKHELFIYNNYEEIKELILKRNEGLIDDL
jgi:glucose-6-phosphate 1-dehydrogenase